MTPQSPSKQALWDLTQFSQSLSAVSSYFPESYWWSEIFSSSKVILVLGKVRNCGMPNLSCKGTVSPGWFDVLPKIAWDIMCEWVCCCDEAANHQLPIAAGLPNHLDSFCGGLFKLNAKFDADSLLRFLGHFECYGHTVHMLTQQRLPPPLTSTWSHHCSRRCIPVHSP